MAGPAKELVKTGQTKAALEQGLDYISEESEYQFQLYKQKVLPADGYVFWMPSGGPVTVKGSLHYSLETLQEADEMAGDGIILFTTAKQLMTFGQTKAPTLMVVSIGENQADDPAKKPVRFAFSGQGNFYAQAGLWHYNGRRVMPAMASQLLDAGVTIDPSRAITSNSLPLWLAMNDYIQAYGGPPTGPGLTLYPSYLVAENITPPYGVVDIIDTDGLASAPTLSESGAPSHTQLCRDVIDVTLYGLQNNEALLFQDFVNQYSLDTDLIGIMNVPVVKDEKRVQAELRTIGMKKTMRYIISYYQSNSLAVARALIESAPYDFYINPQPL